MEVLSTVSVTFPGIGTATKEVSLGNELIAFDEIMAERFITNPETATEEGMIVRLRCGVPNLTLDYRFNEGNEIVARTKLADYLAFRGVDINEPTPSQGSTPQVTDVPVQETVETEQVPVNVQQTETQSPEVVPQTDSVPDQVTPETVEPTSPLVPEELVDPNFQTGAETGNAPEGTPLDPNAQV